MREQKNEMIIKFGPCQSTAEGTRERYPTDGEGTCHAETTLLQMIKRWQAADAGVYRQGLEAAGDPRIRQKKRNVIRQCYLHSCFSGLR